MYVPEQGDIIQLNFDPSAGKEIMKFRSAYVVSKQAFNAHTEFAIVAPITSTKRGIALEVQLSEKTTTQGAILMHQMRSLDFKSRGAKFVEKSPADIIEKAQQIAKIIVS